MAHSQESKPNTRLLAKTFMVAALALSVRAGNAQDGIGKSAVTLRKALDSLQEINLDGFRIQFDGDRVGSKLVALSLIDATGRVRE